MKINLLILLIFFGNSIGWSQELNTEDSIHKSAVTIHKKFYINGYIKNMQVLDFNKNLGRLNATDLIHNRINCKWKPKQNITLNIELRNRFIWGDDVRNIPSYTLLLRNTNETVNLSKIWLSNESFVMHTNTDRLNLDYKIKKLSIRLGRQRINWGISTIWNPNDLFNTYNFLDFDYEERPGSDAIRLIGNITSFSGLELAYAHGNKTSKNVFAGKYFFNKNGYDVQIITGILGNRFTTGVGWAGSIKDAGFKGEMQFFSNTLDNNFQINITLEGDYVFKNGLYINGSFLYNNNGLNTNKINPIDLNFKFTPAYLMPTKFNFVIASGKEITPLFSANLSVLFAPRTNLLLILPSLNYSLSDNLNANLVWQSFFASFNQFSALNHRGYLRLKYNF